MIENLIKGCIPDPIDERDYKAEPLMGSVQIDFSQEFRLPTPPDTDQGQADCCVGEGSSSYHWQLRGVQFAVKSVFAYIAQSYGASIRDGVMQIRNFGQQTFAEIPDPNPKTAQNMRDRSGLNPLQALEFKEFDAFTLPQQDINGVAWGVKNYRGVLFGVSGTNAGWQDLVNPTPPVAGDLNPWGHCLYAMGYHTHSDGQKCIIAKSSWCNVVKEHHIREKYFLTGNVFSAWTLIPKQLIDTKMQLIKDNGTVFLVGTTKSFKIGIGDLAAASIFNDEPITDGDTSKIPQTGTLADGIIFHK